MTALVPLDGGGVFSPREDNGAAAAAQPLLSLLSRQWSHNGDGAGMEQLSPPPPDNLETPVLVTSRAFNEGLKLPGKKSSSPGSCRGGKTKRLGSNLKAQVEP